jgi:hypothetical protein
MRIIFTLIFLILSYVSCAAQSTEDTLLARLGLNGLQLPADQVFLHTDRNIYYPGDTIYFHAFIRDRQTGVFETGSISLYAMLVSDNHKTIDSARFRIDHSTASGWLKIPTEISTGIYSLLSFTSIMMNYAPEFIFNAPLKIDKKRVFRSTPGRRTGEKDILEYLMDEEPQNIDLRFLPEGGTFVYGIRQRIAFNAVTSTGSNIRCKGHIINNKGELITDFSSGMFSPGDVEFTPESGYTYSAVLEGDQFTGMKWPLPIPEKSGTALRVNPLENNMIEVKIESRGVTGRYYTIALTMNNVLVLSQQFRIDSIYKMKINASALPVGTAYITLFDNELIPVAERMIFLNKNNEFNIELKTSADSYNRGEETILTINTTDYTGKNQGSFISLSAADSTFGYDDALPIHNIESTFLFDNFFWNNLPGSIRQHGLFNIDEENLDLLFMTYGWKRYVSKEVKEAVNDIKLTDYDLLIIRNPGPAKKTRFEITLTTLEGGDIHSLKKDANGNAVLHFDTLDIRARQIMILPDKNPSKNAYPLRAEFSFDKEFIKQVKSVKSELIIQETDFSFKRRKEENIFIDSAILIEPVNIRAPIKPVEVFYNKYQEMFRNVATTTVTSKDFRTAFNFEDILLRLNPYMIDRKNKYVYLRYMGRKPLPALIVIDDLPLYGEKGKLSYALIADMPANDISSVTALKGVQGYTLYGEDALFGVVFVITKVGKWADGDFSEEDLRPSRPKDDLMKTISIFRKEAEYYIPEKEEVKTIPEFQFRPTLYWNNEIFLDGSGPVTITFPNHLLNGKVIVIANGVSVTNIPGAARITYMIK